MTRPTVGVWADGRPAQIGLYTWHYLLVEEALPDVEDSNWQTGAEHLGAVVEASDEVILHVRSTVPEFALVRIRGCLVHLGLQRGRLGCLVAGEDRNSVKDATGYLRELVPEGVPDERGRRVALNFWYIEDRGPPGHLTREIAVPSWDDVAENYTAPTRTALARLVEELEPGTGGQLILWHGPPGTGKTYALRSLAWEWRSWADFHYVTDPEVLFGGRPDYLMALILGSETATPNALEQGNRWTVLVLEDMGELLAPDARMQMGQGLSRLLNLVDGVLGQGLNLLVLITTNEPLARVHPAVARPGRCAAEVEFGELQPEEVAEWFASRGTGVPPELSGERASISILHAALDGRAPERRRVVGFAR
jgi:hypothetical protein